MKQHNARFHEHNRMMFVVLHTGDGYLQIREDLYKKKKTLKTWFIVHKAPISVNACKYWPVVPLILI